MITVRLDGVKGLNAALKKMDKALTVGVDAEMAASVATINNEQKNLAPVDFGILRNSLQQLKISTLNYAIFTNNEYAPYQEFGTGAMVDIPKGLEAEAAQFRGKGIRQVNIRPRYFFYPPFFKEKVLLIKRIKDLLK